MKRTIFVGQAMPRVKRDPHDWPTLNVWLYEIGLDEEMIKENFLYTALVDYFPGMKKSGHLVPTKLEIAKERKRLQKTIVDFNPELVVSIGKLSLSYCLNKKINLMNEYIGESFEVDPYELLGKTKRVIPLPHPSGASTWKYNKNNRKLLQKALGLLKQELQLVIK